MSPRRPRSSEGGARARALRLLARREHSRAELAAKLGARGHGKEEIEAALAGLAEAGLQSDARYAEAYARSRMERGYGPLRIRAELAARGVDETLAERAVAALGADWTAQAAALRARRFGPGLPRAGAERARQARWLAGRGFPAEVVRAVLKGWETDDER